MTARTIAVGGASYPLVLPNIRDPRLHVAAVIITIHAFGQLGLDFGVSIPQILAAILTCAAIEIALTFRQAAPFVWPASAMLTGSGVALILRVWNGAGPPLDHRRLVRLRGGCRPLAPHEVRHQVPRFAHLQPVQHRLGRGVRPSRQHSRRAARLLVVAVERLADRRVHRDHRRRRPDQPAPASPRDRRHVLAHARRRDRHPRRLRPLHDGRLGVRPRSAASTSGA